MDAVVAATFDISEFLVDVLGVTDVGAYFPHVVTYHPTCHSLRVAHVGDKPMAPAGRPRDHDQGPSGRRPAAASAAPSLKNPDVSVAMAADKARNVASTRAEYLVAGDNLCLLNMLRRPRAPANPGIRPIHLVKCSPLMEDHGQGCPSSSRGGLVEPPAMTPAPPPGRLIDSPRFPAQAKVELGNPSAQGTSPAIPR